MFYLRSFPLFLKSIKIEPVTELSRVARLACALRNEDSRNEIVSETTTKKVPLLIRSPKQVIKSLYCGFSFFSYFFFCSSFSLPISVIFLPLHVLSDGCFVFGLTHTLPHLVKVPMKRNFCRHNLKIYCLKCTIPKF